MVRKLTRWAYVPLLVAGLLTGLAGGAAAQLGTNNDIGALSDSLDTLDDMNAFSVCGGSDGLTSVADVDVDARVETRAEQDVDLDEDEVFVSIALLRNGIGGASFADLADTQASVERDVSVSQESDLDRDDVFTVLALDGNVGGSNDLLLCAGERDVDARVRADVDRSVDLDEDTAFSAIALSRTAGGVDFEDVADFEMDTSFERSFSSDVDLDRDDALLLLALD